jgi:dipeptidyl-peptidase-4
MMRNDLFLRAVFSGKLLLIASVVILFAAPVYAEEPSNAEKLTLDRIFNGKEFSVERFGPARWLEDGSGYTTLEASADVESARDIVRYSPSTGERSVLVPATSLVPEGATDPLSIKDYQWSEDGKLLLIFTNSKRVWRRNTRGDYWVLDVAGGTLRKLGGDVEEATMMFAKLSPDGGRVAWVDFREKDLFVQSLVDLAVTRLTDDASPNIINGTSDWVYEEEFDLRDGFRWSPDGQRIAYWQFDAEGVQNYYLINNTDTIYPELTALPYPKVGTTNPACRVGVISADGGATQWFEPEGDSRNHYIPKMDWAESSDEVLLIRLNRLQNTAEVMLGDAGTGDLRTVFTDVDEAWLDVDDLPMWLEGGTQFTWLSERDGWRHLYLVSRSGDEIRLVTPGAYDVVSLVRVDAEGGWVYFVASPDDPTTRYLYRTPLDGSGKPERLTPAGLVGTHGYQISEDARWAIHSFSSFEVVPQTALVSLPDHQTRRMLEDNAAVQANFDALAKQPVEAFRIDIGDGVVVDGWMIKPPDFDPSQRYPLLVFVYGEPAGQTVGNRWGRSNQLWHLLLAQRGYLVASLDNHGTPAPRGREWRKSVYRQIGILASADQAAGVRALIASRPYIDPERIGTWGWSGGGTMTLNALFRYPDLYSVGMAVAVISDQKVYDTVYQERYMGLPEDNADGFRDGSPITFADQLEGDLLLVHGTGDDNCHYQSFELLVNELIAHGKQFDMMSYPNRSHGIYEGEGTTMHLRNLLTNYLLEHLAPGPKPIPAEHRTPEAKSFLGVPLFSPQPVSEAVAKHEIAKREWEATPSDADKIIWYGRRTAYLGQYREAIRIFSNGLELHPEDARFYRHRGHRFITTRRLEEAIADLAYAAILIEEQEDQIEPDGLPNALGIPVSTLHTNIWYHLGLAHYLSGDYQRAEEAYRAGVAATTNDDMLVAFTHWLYMTLRRLERDREAEAVLEPISADMEIIENSAYHRLCLFYRNELSESDLTSDTGSSAGAATAYGLANWHLAGGETEVGTEMLKSIVAQEGWAAFGHIAAEADLARNARD